jgi:aminoglycoside 6'-N-acetyltransferase
VIAFRPMAADDLPRLRRWLEAPHVRLWWREPVDEAMAKRLTRSATREFVIVVDGRPVGWIQTYLVAAYPDWGEIVGTEPGLAGVDLAIGEAELIGRGLGPRVLAQFADDVAFADPETTAVLATVEEGNRRSWRAFEKAGFRHVRDVVEEGLPHRLMRLDRR